MRIILIRTTGYFDDLNLGEGYDEWIRQGMITESEYQSIKKSHEALEAYTSPGADYDHEKIFQDPVWIHITQLARETLKTLKPS